MGIASVIILTMDIASVIILTMDIASVIIFSGCGPVKDIISLLNPSSNVSVLLWKQSKSTTSNLTREHYNLDALVYISFCFRLGRRQS